MVIPGWDEGVLGMKVGGVRRLVLPPALAYGEGGRPPIPPNAVLVFDIQLVSLGGVRY
jgi:FKBP-type peptidyl-prolyl cis-trans isomerase FkpA